MDSSENQVPSRDLSSEVDNTVLHGTGGLAPTDRGAARRRTAPGGYPALVVLSIVLLVLLVGGTAAFTVPAFAVNADTSLGGMLPATTVFYVSANLNPSGSTKDNLDRITRVYTSQQAWHTIASTYNTMTQNSQSSSGSCYRQTTGQISDHLRDLGQDTALALTEARGINVSRASSSQTMDALKRAFVVVAPLHTKLTLVQALSGFNISLAQKTGTYKGIDIYRETFQSCGQADAGAANAVYAAMVKHWVVLGLVPQAIYPIVDTANGRRASLASTRSYRSLMARVAGDHLASYYLNGRALARMGVFNALKSGSPTGQVPASTYAGAERQTMATLSVDSHGFKLRSATYNPSGRPVTGPAAGAAASMLPDNTLALLSIRDLKQSLASTIKPYEQSGLINSGARNTLDHLVSDLTANLTGEADMVMLRPSKTMSSSDPSSVPLAFMWQVNSGSSAERHLRDAASRLGLRRFSHGTASNGTGYQTTTQGIGYAIRNGWAIASASIRQTLDTLSSKPTHTLADIGAYKRGVNGPFTATSAFYVDVRGFRKALEDALLPGQTQANRSQYTTYVVPFIAPIRSVSGSTGTTRDGKTDTSTVVVDIGSESRS